MSAGRITVERSPTGQAVGLALAHWDLNPVAILTLDETRELIHLLTTALEPTKETQNGCHGQLQAGAGGG